MRNRSFLAFFPQLTCSLNPLFLHCGVRTAGQAAAGLMINDVYSWQKAPLFICIAAQQIPSVTWMKNIHSYQFCCIIEWSHFPSVVFFPFPLCPLLFLLSLFSDICHSYHCHSNFRAALFDMERLALATFDIKLVQFSHMKERLREWKDAKKVTCHFLKITFFFSSNFRISKEVR